MKRISMVLCILFCMFSSGYAQTTQRNETVYVNLDGHGKVEQTQVVTWLHTDGNAPNADRARLENIEAVTLEANPVIDGNNIQFNSGVRDIFYRGTTSAELPVSVEIKYLLNGQVIPYDALEGKSGDFEIQVHIINTTRVMSDCTYRQVGTDSVKTVREELYVPFIVRVDTDFDIEMFQDVRAPEASFVVLGRTMKMNWIVFPAPEETFVIRAKVKDLHMPGFIFTAVPRMLPLPDIDIKSNLDKVYDGVDEVGGYLVSLQEGAQKIHNGETQMIGALDKVRDGTDLLIRASDAQMEIIDGAKKINQGMQDKLALPVIGAMAKKPLYYLEIQAQLLDLAAKGGAFSPEILEFLSEQGKAAPEVTEFPGIEVTKEGISRLNNGAKEMIDGANKLQSGSMELATSLERVKKEGTDQIKNGITDGTDPLMKKIAMIEEAKKLAEGYNYFAGILSKTKSSVEFVMKTP
ncbi:MAG: hypothetical protein U9P80_05495 [Thermodesulfobacteriota bacterium]|nr:hypothetical protein [Thermodesulfobacteriota bacterium]